MATADLTPSQDRELTDRDRYPVPFKVFDFLRNELGLETSEAEDLKIMGDVFRDLGYTVNSESLRKGTLEVSRELEDGTSRSPHLIVLNK